MNGDDVMPVIKRIGFTRAELDEMEWALRLRLDHWDDDDQAAHDATESAHRKVLAALGRVR